MSCHSISVVSLTDLRTILSRHSRVNGNPVALVLDFCLRRNDNLSGVISETTHWVVLAFFQTQFRYLAYEKCNNDYKSDRWKVKAVLENNIIDDNKT